MKELFRDQPKKLVEYRERIFRYGFPNDIAWETRGDNAKFGRPHQVLQLRPGDELPPFDLGRLPVGIYNLRLVGALRFEDDWHRRSRGNIFMKDMLFRLQVNDGPDGKESTYILRGRTMSNFYSTVEFFLHVDDDRRLTAKLSYLPASEIDVYVYNVDLHDVAGASTFKALKRARVLPSSPEAKLAVAAMLEREESGKTRPLSARRLRELWQALPPPNTMFRVPTKEIREPVNYNYRVENRALMWRYQPKRFPGAFRLARTKASARLDDVDGPAKKIEFSLGGDDGKGEDADIGMDLEEEKLQTEFTYDEVLRRGPLPGTKDFGCGQRVRSHKGDPRWLRYRADLAIAAGQAMQAVMSAAASGLTSRSQGLTHFDQAFLLCAFAYHYPTYARSHHLPDQVDRWQNDRRHVQHNIDLFRHVEAMCERYDEFFPYISKSQTLAAALGRFIPWIKTPRDVVRLVDTYLIQQHARLYTHFLCFLDESGSAASLINLATILGDAETSQPWLDFLASKNFVYPNALGSFTDGFSIGTTRDGGTTIGSFYYGQSPSFEFVEMLDRYSGITGNVNFDLSRNTFAPKALAALEFRLEGRVAGGHNPGIGDVGGPSMPFLHWANNLAPAGRMLYRWTKQPEYAKVIVKYGRRGVESKQEWDRLTALAKTVRDPLLNQRSRVLTQWQGILESGAEYDDHRAKAAVSVRVGAHRRGHSHSDTLDLRVFAHGVTMSGDAGMRGAYGLPTHALPRIHNVVDIDGGAPGGYAWIGNLADMPGAGYLSAFAHRQPRPSQRQVALVKAIDGDLTPGAASTLTSPEVETPEHYVFDVFRAAAGRVHTYCFHGCVDDGLEVNVGELRHPEGARKKYLQDFYYGEYYDRIAMAYGFAPTIKKEAAVVEEEEDDGLDEKPVVAPPRHYQPWIADCQDDALVATWQLERKAEKRMVGRNAAPTTTRKFTRLTLFEQKDKPVLHGICITDPNPSRINPQVPWYASRQLYARAETTGEPRGHTFVALIEPYAGTPAIVGRRLLPIEGAPSGPLRPVAVAVDIRGGRRDLCFADGQPGEERQIEGDVRVAAEFAFLSRDANGLRQASITGGRLLRAADIEIVPAAAEYRAVVKRVDYRSRRVYLDQPLPPTILDGQYMEVVGPGHRTGYTVADVTLEAGAAVLALRKATEIFRSRVMYVNGNNVHLALARKLLAGQNSGKTATTEDYAKEWKAEMLPEGDRWDGFIVKLTGAPVNPADLPPGSGLIVHEFGPGDEFRAATFVSLRRLAPTDFEATANVPFRLTIPAAACQVSLDGAAWRELAGKQVAGRFQVTIRPESIGARTFHLRAGK